ncbi:fructokinase [Dethiosulfatibacter aminovorans DSM 17477]|uniref:Fructokinase n=1 Tax=Dethiosulfatibacter aminovorans DSM 17477 TaxID=1121476 RepID=A0A1M6E5L0_9FIRM|nr:carbohydrate kinase [Dethiosulfatibacter aminovorans]SHI80650.1 fructokinase [Dethiosulfatibacter aminovorans DSM 17477]
MIDILAIGELLIDFTPISKSDGMQFKANPGGAPCNMLAMAQKLGAKTAFIGKVGDDKFGHMLKATLDGIGIDTGGLILSQAYPTTLAFVHLSEDGERSFSFYRNACADIMLEECDIDYEMIDESRTIHFGSLSFTDSPSKETVTAVLKYAKEKKKLITYDPNYRPLLWEDESEAISWMLFGLEFADIVKVSDEEAVLLTGEDNIIDAGGMLLNHGPALVCITLGKEGAVFFTKDGHRKVGGFKSKVVDTTGAGDSFFGAVVQSLLKQEKDVSELSMDEIEECVKTGNAAAALCIGGYGGIPSLPDAEEVYRLRDE